MSKRSWSLPPPRRRRWALPLAAILVLRAAVAVASPVAPTHADGDGKAAASAHLARGAELIDAENLEAALAEFEAAYRLVPSPNIFHNFGIVYQGLGRKAAALDAFQRFLDEAPHPPAAAREHAQRAVQVLRAEVAELRVQTDVAGAIIFIDGRSAGESPQQRPMFLDPGPHHLSVEKPGGGTVHTQRLVVSAGEHLTVSAPGIPTARVPLTALDERQPPSPSQSASASAASPSPLHRRWQRPAAWAATAAAALAAGVFATEMFVHRRHSIDFNDKGCGTRDAGQGGEDCADLASRRQNAAKWAAVSGVSAGVLAVAATALFLMLPEMPGGRSVSLRASPSLVGLVLQGRF